MPVNPWKTNNFIDSCAFNPHEDESTAANELFMLAKEHGLALLIAHSVAKEIDHPNTPKWVKLEANGRIRTIGVNLVPEENAQLARIVEILAGNGNPESVRDDANHIFEAKKYGSYFVTTDKRILKKAGELKEITGTLIILLPSEFLRCVHSFNEKVVPKA